MMFFHLTFISNFQIIPGAGLVGDVSEQVESLDAWELGTCSQVDSLNQDLGFKLACLTHQ